jgi:hypothetical protein
MKYAIEMCSGAMIYIASFIKFGSGIQKLVKGDTQTHIRYRYLISTHFFNNESRIKNEGSKCS